MKKNDLILAGVVILIVLLCFGGIKLYQSSQGGESNTANAGGHLYLQIIQDQKLIERIDLNAVTEPREIKLPGEYEEVVIVEKGRAAFKETKCPDQICVKTGWISEPGSIAVCLPNKAIIAIESEN